MKGYINELCPQWLLFDDFVKNLSSSASKKRKTSPVMNQILAYSTITVDISTGIPDKIR